LFLGRPQTGTCALQEEKSEQLRTFAFISGIVYVAAMLALVEINYEPERVPPSVAVAFVVSIGITVQPRPFLPPPPTRLNAAPFPPLFLTPPLMPIPRVLLRKCKYPVRNLYTSDFSELTEVK
jgi:hypothetical protein